ncbi:MAG: hypothetical protein N3B16_04960, partial [Candidatus Aminicenantes bacterium]|nr:hypothetical protein [Candidatus Aminicenantes bacterium]
VLAKDCVAKLMEKHFKESDSPVGAIVPLLKFYDLKGFINGLGNHLRSFSWGSDNFIGAVDLGQLAQIKAVPSACFAAVLIFREALEKVGPLDDAYSSFYEDIDWSFRCWLNGFKIVPCSEAIVYHHFSSSYVGGQKLFFVCRNRLRLILKLFSLKNLFHFLQNYLAEDLKALFSFLRHRHWDNFLIYLKAYLSLMASLPDILIKRLKFMRRKIKEKNEAHVLALNPESWSFLNTQNEPVINFNLVCHYYLRHIN